MNDHPAYTARNSKDWQRENEKAQRYLNPQAPVSQASVDRAQALRRALALRHSHRIAAGARAWNGGTKHQQVLHTLMMRLHGVREAESIERLIDRDRTLTGFIAGLIVGECLSQDEAGRAIELRRSAFDMRHSEFAPKLPVD